MRIYNCNVSSFRYSKRKYKRIIHDKISLCMTNCVHAYSRDSQSIEFQVFKESQVSNTTICQLIITLNVENGPKM